MWRLLSTPIFVFSLILPTLSFAGPSWPPHVEQGPTSDEEARVLWSDGQADAQAARWDEAIPKLERFVARYPAYPGANEASLLLARAYLQTRRPAQAKPLLKDFVMTHPKSAEGMQARILLIRTRLALQELTEALLGCQEIEKFSIKTLPSDSPIRAEALLLKSKTLVGLKKDRPAQQALGDGLKLITPASAPALRGEGQTTRLELKLLECAKFPSSGPLDEGVVRHQLDRRGTCLLESLQLARETSQIGYLPSTQVSAGLVSHAFADYLVSCQHPPAPPKLKPKDRDPQQRETYFKELRTLLAQDCRKKVAQAVDLLGKSNNEISTELEKLLK